MICAIIIPMGACCSSPQKDPAGVYRRLVLDLGDGELDLEGVLRLACLGVACYQQISMAGPLKREELVASLLVIVAERGTQEARERVTKEMLEELVQTLVDVWVARSLRI